MHHPLMPPSTPSSSAYQTTAPRRPGSRTVMDIDDAIAQNERDALLEERREAIIAEVRAFTQFTFEELGAASKQETDLLLEGTKHIKLSEEEIAGWERFCEERLSAMKASAQKLYYDQFMDPLLAELGKTISRRVIEDLNKKFRDPNAHYKAKEDYIRYTLPERIREWRALKQRRDSLTKNPRYASLTPSLVPRLKDFAEEERFIDLKYQERKGLTDQVEAALTALDRRQEQQYASIHDELKSYVQEDIMHASKLGSWLKRIFDGNRSPEDIAAYMQQVVRPFAANWREAMFGSKKYKGFIDLEHAFQKHGVPRGLQRKSKSQFLLMSYKQKTSYLSLAWARMKDPDGSLEENKMLAAHKLRIRHRLDTEDWEDAEAELQKAMAIAPEDVELRSMLTFLDEHRPKNAQPEKQENPDPHKILDDIRTMVRKIPSPLQSLYQQALMEGPAVLGRLQQVVYNRVWLTDVAGWNPTIESEYIARLRATGRQGKGYLLDLNSRNGSDILSQIRDHADEQAGKTPPRFSSDEHWGYWASVIPEEVTVDTQREIVRNYHYHLKRWLRQLHSMGCAYTMSGNLTRKDGSIVPHLN